MGGLDPDTNNNNNNYNPHKEDGIISRISLSEGSDSRQVRRVKRRRKGLGNYFPLLGLATADYVEVNVIALGTNGCLYCEWF